MLQYYPIKLFFAPQKSLWAHNFRLRRRMIMIFYSTCSPTPVDDFTYPYHGVMMSRKFSTGGWSWKTPPKTASCSWNFEENLLKSPLWVGMKTQKLPSASVLSCRNRLRCRAVLPFAFTDRYDPKQHCKYLGWHAKAYRKFFGTSQSCKAHLENSTFWLKFCVLALFYLENGYENWKMAISLRFEL